MNITEFSEITGISAHTLRYYEKRGIFQEILRNASGHRNFSEHDVAWAEFINRLKETGMPLEKIKEYAQLREQGESTAPDRMQMLMAHAEHLKKKLAEDQQHLTKLKEKIRYYQDLIAEKIPA